MVGIFKEYFGLKLKQLVFTVFYFAEMATGFGFLLTPGFYNSRAFVGFYTAKIAWQPAPHRALGHRLKAYSMFKCTAAFPMPDGGGLWKNMKRRCI